MAEKATVTRTVPAHTVTQNTIQWGNVIKGVAIVAAVVVVGVVSYGAISGFLTNTALGGQVLGFFGGAADLFMSYIWPVFESIGTAIAGGVSGLFNTFFPTVGEAAFVAEMARNPGTVGLIATAGAAATGLAAVKLTGADHHLADAAQHLTVRETIQMPEQVVKEQVALPSQPSHSSPEVTRSNVAPSQSGQSSQSWAERAPQTSRRDIAPRASSHAEQIQADPAHSALAEAAR